MNVLDAAIVMRHANGNSGEIPNLLADGAFFSDQGALAAGMVPNLVDVDITVVEGLAEVHLLPLYMDVLAFENAPKQCKLGRDVLGWESVGERRSWSRHIFTPPGMVFASGLVRRSSSSRCS